MQGPRPIDGANRPKDGGRRSIQGALAEAPCQPRFFVRLTPPGKEHIKISIIPDHRRCRHHENRRGVYHDGCRKNVYKGLAISRSQKPVKRFASHAKETGNPIPAEPIFFLKANTALSGPNDAVEKPRGSTKLDWEVEIAAIIGTRAKYVSEADALNHVAGYCVCNDVSERNFQIERLGQWTKGKSHDTFGPLGPWLVTKDEIPDVQKLSMWLDVNGERRQTGSTSTMIFSMAKCISYVSQFLTLLPGDIVTTGTPPGVGSGMKPPKFLNVGDVVTLSIEGLGEQRQEIVAA